MSKPIDFESISFDEFLNGVADKTPVPGGGAVAAAVGALGGALAQMCMRYSIRKKTSEEKRERIDAFIHRFDTVVQNMLDAAAEDAAAYAELNRLQRLEPEDRDRQTNWDQAVTRSINAPLGVVQRSGEALRSLKAFGELCDRWLLSDLAIAAILADAAARTAGWNIRINLPLVEDATRRIEIETETSDLLAECLELAAAVESFCANAVSEGSTPSP
jgi:formiminotetrahydrofolate cyclodeaminase